MLLPAQMLIADLNAAGLFKIFDPRYKPQQQGISVGRSGLRWQIQKGVALDSFHVLHQKRK